MRISGLDIALKWASRGAKVLYVCEHWGHISAVLYAAGEYESVVRIRRSNGDARVRTTEGGAIHVIGPEESVRGRTFDLVLAPPSVWKERGEDLRICTLGSDFFPGGRAFGYSTLERVEL